ncbi:MAG: AzlC family ABC transporter permease [Bdellovibrionota bacterium]
MNFNDSKYFFDGARRMLPVLTGVIPFGLVMGTVSADAELSLGQSVSMNFLAYAGAAQLAAIDLMTKQTPILVIILTGLVINLRFLLYSAAMAPALRNSSFGVKLTSAYFLTDQAYAVVSAHEDELPGPKERVQFYLGTSVCMAIFWHLSVVAGYSFGNFAPKSWSLEYAVPLSFVALLVPTLKNRSYIYVAAFSSVISVLLHELPYRLGLVVTAILALTLAAWISRKRVAR